MRSDKIVGEIENQRNYNIDNVYILALGKDIEGKIIDISSTFVNGLKADSTVPFDIYHTENENIVTVEYYANQW